MQHRMHAHTAFGHPHFHEVTATGPAVQAYRILYATFIILPLAAGFDKFFNWLTRWDQYLAPQITSMLGVDPRFFMMGVGIVEILAAILVAAWPQIGGYVVMTWLWLISLNLLLMPGYLDIAARDLALSFGALALARLARTAAPPPPEPAHHEREEEWPGTTS